MSDYDLQHQRLAELSHGAEKPRTEWCSEP